MSKVTLATAIREATGCTKEQASDAVEAVLGSIVKGIMTERQFNIVGFGKFMKVERAVRTGRDPLSGELVELPSFHSIKFQCSSTLRKCL